MDGVTWPTAANLKDKRQENYQKRVLVKLKKFQVERISD